MPSHDVSRPTTCLVIHTGTIRIFLEIVSIFLHMAIIAAGVQPLVMAARLNPKTFDGIHPILQHLCNHLLLADIPM